MPPIKTQVVKLVLLKIIKELEKYEYKKKDSN